MAAGHPDLRIPSSKSELASQCAAMAKHHMHMREQARVIAAVMRRNKTLSGLVGRTIAYRMSRQYSSAVGHNFEAAKAYRRAWELYLQGRAAKASKSAGWSDR